MPRSRRWALAALVLLCVIIAPIQAPGAGLAGDVVDTVIQRDSSDSDAADRTSQSRTEVETESDARIQWQGIRFPNYNMLSASLFSRNLRGEMLPDPAEYRARQGIGGIGGGEELDLPPQSIDGTRVFPLASGTFRISQEFGCVRLDPGYSLADFCPPDRPSFHTGIDFATDHGTTIYASATGTVNFADIDPSSQSKNSVIRIIHDGINTGYMTEYFHWSKSFVEAGEYVIAGQPIGEVGSVGYSTGPHLHYAVFDTTAAEYVEPLEWLKGSESLHVASGDGGVGGVDGVMKWASIIKAASERHNVPAALIAAIITVESSGNPEAVSPVGAQGLMQIMPMHLERYNIPQDMWRDPSTNIEAGTRLLAELIDAHGTLTNAVGAYFGHGCDVLGTCTSEYIARVFDWYTYYVPVFTGVAVDADDFEFELPESSDPGTDDSNDSDNPGEDSTPTPAPSPSPTPDDPSEGSDEGDNSDEQTPDPTPEPEPTPEDPSDGSDEGDDGDQVSPEPTPEPTPPSDNDDASEPTPTPPADGSDDDQNGDGDDQGETDDPDQIQRPEPGVVDGHDSRWRIDPESGEVIRMDPVTEEVLAVIEVGDDLYDITVSEGGVWVTSLAAHTVTRIDPADNSITAVIEVGEGPRGILAVEKGVLVALSEGNKLVRIDYELLEVVDTTELEQAPCDIWIVDNVLMVSDCESDGILEIKLDS
jgi:murein DD-endopeptidase MepM/ murein hydrolase activator NlpD